MMQRAGTSTQAQIFRDPERRATPRNSPYVLTIRPLSSEKANPLPQSRRQVPTGVIRRASLRCDHIRDLYTAGTFPPVGCDESSSLSEQRLRRSRIGRDRWRCRSCRLSGADPNQRGFGDRHGGNVRRTGDETPSVTTTSPFCHRIGAALAALRTFWFDNCAFRPSSASGSVTVRYASH